MSDDKHDDRIFHALLFGVLGGGVGGFILGVVGALLWVSI